MKQRLFSKPVGKHTNTAYIYKFADYLFLFRLKRRKPKSVCSSALFQNFVAIILCGLSCDFFACVNLIVLQYILRELQVVLQQQTRPFLQERRGWPVRLVVARTTSVVFNLIRCFASDSHDTVVVIMCVRVFSSLETVAVSDINCHNFITERFQQNPVFISDPYIICQQLVRAANVPSFLKFFLTDTHTVPFHLLFVARVITILSHKLKQE